MSSNTRRGCRRLWSANPDRRGKIAKSCSHRSRYGGSKAAAHVICLFENPAPRHGIGSDRTTPELCLATRCHRLDRSHRAVRASRGSWPRCGPQYPYHISGSAPHSAAKLVSAANAPLHCAIPPVDRFKIIETGPARAKSPHPAGNPVTDAGDKAVKARLATYCRSTGFLEHHWDIMSSPGMTSGAGIAAPNVARSPTEDWATERYQHCRSDWRALPWLPHR
jgi:hypothetical protein